MAVSYVVDVYRGTLERRDADRRRDVPLVLPAPRRGPDRPRRRAAAAAAAAARRPHESTSPRAARAHHGRALQEGRRQLVRLDDHRPARLQLARAPTAPPRSCSRSGATRSRSTRTSRATPTSRSGSPCSSGSASRSTSTPRTRRGTSRTSGAGGTSRSRGGCATTSTSPSGATGGRCASTCRNIMITMVLGGLWHGANWTFLAWGALHGVGQIVGHLRRSVAPAQRAAARERRCATLGRRQRFFTFQFVSLGVALLQRVVDGERVAAARPARRRAGGSPRRSSRRCSSRPSSSMIAAQYVPVDEGRPRGRLVRQRDRPGAGRRSSAWGCL